MRHPPTPRRRSPRQGTPSPEAPRPPPPRSTPHGAQDSTSSPMCAAVAQSRRGFSGSGNRECRSSSAKTPAFHRDRPFRCQACWAWRTARYTATPRIPIRPSWTSPRPLTQSSRASVHQRPCWPEAISATDSTPSMEPRSALSAQPQSATWRLSRPGPPSVARLSAQQRRRPRRVRSTADSSTQGKPTTPPPARRSSRKRSPG